MSPIITSGPEDRALPEYVISSLEDLDTILVSFFREFKDDTTFLVYVTRFPEITEYLIRPRFPPSLYCSRFLSRALLDLSIGGVSSDTLSTPSDECFVVADIQTYSPVPDAPHVPEVLDVVIALG
ncbi:hypothetical protein F511_18148 [Dorcoceras hygrometricum]|uniref:Uncharacterized protein n=1 Tax=Dorcoceras hygrometricum TaxID=472368 RepID=A0A2Z7BFL2_9LAMI|nr:hypothetical protein F511_18148 [Dorcoceras hygrometricum]